MGLKREALRMRARTAIGHPGDDFVDRGVDERVDGPAARLAALLALKGGGVLLAAKLVGLRKHAGVVDGGETGEGNGGKRKGGDAAGLGRVGGCGNHGATWLRLELVPNAAQGTE